VRARLLSVLQEEFAGNEVESFTRARMVVIRGPGHRRLESGGRVGIVTAGTSDLPAAEEAQVIAREMGCETDLAADVGVAGLHRLVSPLARLHEWGADALIVAAGMDGALPSVVAGLVDIPVIGLPTSRGYGMGGQGEAALLSMLQTCVPGMTVVNIDNGIGAGASAARIANRVAAARARLASPATSSAQ
jgi:pyridinium-3,5-biscarboxylic acid mononucleotide synthase